MVDQVPGNVMDARLQELQALLNRQSARFATALLGTQTDVLIEKPGRNTGQKVGRSPWLIPVVVDEAAGEIGDIVPVTITAKGANSLFAEAN